MVWPIHMNPQLQVSLLLWRHYVFLLVDFCQGRIWKYRWWSWSLSQVFVKVMVFVRLSCRKSIGASCAGWSSRLAVAWQELGHWPPELVFACPPSPEMVFALPWSSWWSGSFRFQCENVTQVLLGPLNIRWLSSLLVWCILIGLRSLLSPDQWEGAVLS